MAPKDKVDAQSVADLMRLPKATLAHQVAVLTSLLQALATATEQAKRPKAGKVELGSYFITAHRRVGRPRKELPPTAYSLADSAHAPPPEPKIRPAVLRLFARAIGRRVRGDSCTDKAAIEAALEIFGVSDAEFEHRVKKITRRLPGDKRLLADHPRMADELERLADTFLVQRKPHTTD
jgi:hypothetical protein